MPLIRRAVAALTALVLAATGLGLLAAPASGATGAAVSISGYAFHPAALTVTAGTTVTWTNTDQAPHDVTTTSAPVPIHGSRMEKGQSWSYTFSTPGTYAYICSIHPDMKATVIVKPAPAPATHPVTHSAPAKIRYTTVPAAGGGMAMPATQRTKRRHASASSSSASAPKASSTTPVPVAVAAAPAATNTTPERPLRPLLIVAGGIAALATLCLLLLAARAELAEPPPR